MVTAAIILAAAVLLAGVVLLWRSTPSASKRPQSPENDQTKDVIVDVSPGGGGGGN